MRERERERERTGSEGERERERGSIKKEDLKYTQRKSLPPWCLGVASFYQKP